jgi:hypothetical protein
MVNNYLFKGKELLPDVITKQGNKRQVNPTKISMVCDTDLEAIPIPEKSDLEYISKYRTLIGGLMFLCVNTFPEISYALSVLSRYLTTVTPQYDIQDKHLLCYVWDRRHAKLTWCVGKVSPPFKAGQFHSFTDSSWDEIVPSRKSTNSYDIFCNNAVVSWKTKLPQIIDTSSSEVELISASYFTPEIAFLRKLDQEIGFVQVSPTIIFEDNNGEISIVNLGHVKGVFKTH